MTDQKQIDITEKSPVIGFTPSVIWIIIGLIIICTASITTYAITVRENSEKLDRVLTAIQESQREIDRRFDGIEQAMVRLGAEHGLTIIFSDTAHIESEAKALEDDTLLSEVIE